MEEPEAELEGLSLVFLGQFHPGMMQPARLAMKNLVREAEAENAEIEVISRDFTQFRMEWVRILVTPERLQLTTELSAYYPALRDLAVGMLRTLPSINIKAFGLNHHAHFKLANKDQWHGLGHALVPKKFWNRVSKDPGTRVLTIEAQRPDEYRGRVNLTVEPSARVEHGVYLGSNDHFDITADAEDSAESAASLVGAGLDASLERSRVFFSELIRFAVGDGDEE